MPIGDITNRDVNCVVSETIPYPIAEVWLHLATVGNEDQWYGGCTKSEVEPGLTGVGAFRTLHFAHGVYRERVEEIDRGEHLFVYRVLEPHVIPCEDPMGYIQLKSEASDVTRVTWTSTALKWDQEKRALTKKLSEATYTESIARLAGLCEASRTSSSRDTKY